MEIRYNIINVAEILFQLGKDVEANALDELIKNDSDWHYDSFTGIRRCLGRFLDRVSNLSEGDGQKNYELMRTYQHNFLEKEKFYDINTDSIQNIY